MYLFKNDELLYLQIKHFMIPINVLAKVAKWLYLEGWVPWLLQ